VGILPLKGFAELDAWMLSLGGTWRPCTVNYTRNSSLATKGKHKIEGGMSGSLIVTDNGFAIGALCCSGQLARNGRRTVPAAWQSSTRLVVARHFQ
jgi:hypothetical protein